MKNRLYKDIRKYLQIQPLHHPDESLDPTTNFVFSPESAVFFQCTECPAFAAPRFWKTLCRSGGSGCSASFMWDGSARNDPCCISTKRRGYSHGSVAKLAWHLKGNDSIGDTSIFHWTTTVEGIEESIKSRFLCVWLSGSPEHRGYSNFLAGTGALTKRVESKKLTPPKFNSLPQKIDDWKTRFLVQIAYFWGANCSISGVFHSESCYGEEFLAAQFKKHHFVRSWKAPLEARHSTEFSDLQIPPRIFFTSSLKCWGFHVEKSYPEKSTNIPWSAGPFLEGNESSEPTHQPSTFREKSMQIIENHPPGWAPYSAVQ